MGLWRLRKKKKSKARWLGGSVINERMNSVINYNVSLRKLRPSRQSESSPNWGGCGGVKKDQMGWKKNRGEALCLAWGNPGLRHCASTIRSESRAEARVSPMPYEVQVRVRFQGGLLF